MGLVVVQKLLLREHALHNLEIEAVLLAQQASVRRVEREGTGVRGGEQCRCEEGGVADQSAEQEDDRVDARGVAESQVVLEERGEEALKEPECTADLNITANIAKTYVTSGEQRMDLYRRMAAIRTQEDADELLDEIVDRFGDPPKGVMNLIAIALLRARAAAAGITEITQKDGAVLLSLSTMDFAAISACCAEAQFKGRIFFSAGKVPMLSVKLKKAEDPLKLATQLVGVYAALRAQTAGT